VVNEARAHDLPKILDDASARRAALDEWMSIVMHALEAKGFALIAYGAGERPRIVQSVSASRNAPMRSSSALALLVHPEPGLVGVIWFSVEGAARLCRSERTALSRVSLRVETALRLRLRPDAVRLTVRNDVWGDAAARDAIWKALAAGRYGLVERGGAVVVIVNASECQAKRRLSAVEEAVVLGAARAVPGKVTAFSLGISPSAVSLALGSAAAKMGLVPVAELPRVVSGLVDPSSPVDDTRLTAAERDVLDLLVEGKSNREIADTRGRSERTVANQVASILAKTGCSSRRALRVLLNR
jgi:DNA-binding CsgD family transcriptional regulator